MRSEKIDMEKSANGARLRSHAAPDDWSNAATATIVASLAGFSAMIALAGPSPVLAVAVILLASIACLLNEPGTARPLAIAVTLCLLVGVVRTRPDLSDLVLAPMALVFCEGMVGVRRRLVSAERAANVDSLTGALTPRGFARMLGKELPKARRDDRATALVFIDLDHFKSVNDRFGHAAGDTVLCQLVTSLKARLLSDDHIARIGGDEFLVFLRYADEPGRIDSFQANMLGAVGDLPYDLTASAGGLVLPPADYPDAAAIIQSADRLMYEVKHAGRGRIQFGRLDPLDPDCANRRPATIDESIAELPVR